MRLDHLDDVIRASLAASPTGRVDVVAYAVNLIDWDEKMYRQARSAWPLVDGPCRLRQLTAGNPVDRLPRWSPDGTRIGLFSSTRRQ